MSLRRTRLASRGACLTCAVALYAGLCAGAAAAQTDTVSIPAARDTTIMEAHPRDNDGAWGYLWLKWNSARGFENRVVLGFDLVPLAGRAADVLSATLVLRAADHTFPSRGTRLGAFFMQPEASPTWAEGRQSFDTFAYCGRRDLFRVPTGEGEPGASWTCEDDRGALDPLGAASCAPSPLASPWLGGLLPPGVPLDQPRGFRAVATTSQVEVKGYDPLCRRALSCFAATSSTDCWRVVEIEVTPDVREALSLGVHAASWLLKKDRVEAGAARFFSREGARCLLGVPELQPQLRVTLAQGSHPPVVVAEPPIDCGG